MLEGREKMERIKCLYVNVKIKNPHHIWPGLTMSTGRLLILPFVEKYPTDVRFLNVQRDSDVRYWKVTGSTLVSNSPLIDYFNHNHKKPVCISMRLCLLQHVTHTNFHWGHTYPSWGMRTRALGRSSTEELTIVSLKSPSGWATWQKKKKKRERKAKMDLNALKGPHCKVSYSTLAYTHALYGYLTPLQTDCSYFQSEQIVPSSGSCDNSHMV